jgi:hypothetical protein
MATLAELIAQAKTLVPAKLSDDDPLMESAWNKLVDLVTHYNDQVLTKLDALIPPVGFMYIQFPGTPDPSLLWDNPGSRWENVSSRFPGTFFRAEGGGASAFSTASTSPALAVGDNGSTGGQVHGAPNILGDADIFADSLAFERRGAITVTRVGVAREPLIIEQAGDASGIRFDASYSNSVYGSSTEVRPKNITVRVWRRKA